MKWGLKGGISIYTDSGPPRYVLWCCGGICHQPDTFIQIGSGHTVEVNNQSTAVWWRYLTSFLAQFLKQHIMLSFDELLPGTEWDLGLSKRSWLVLIQEFRSPDKKGTINWVHSEKQVRILMPFLQNRFNSVIQSITQIQTNISCSWSSLLLSCKKKKSYTNSVYFRCLVDKHGFISPFFWMWRFRKNKPPTWIQNLYGASVKAT